MAQPWPLNLISYRTMRLHEHDGRFVVGGLQVELNLL
jgi:hypothetical protein